MSMIGFDVDIYNPGQFYACLGILSVADSLAPGATGQFDDGSFMITAENISPADLIRGTLGVNVKPLFDDKIAPLVFQTERTMLITWWCKWKMGEWEKTGLKLWAGNQTSYTIPTKLLQAAVSIQADAQKNPRRLFSVSGPINGRYGVDPCCSWQALNVGFSPNEHNGDATTCLYTEILAAIGLQYAAPLSESNGQMAYYTWPESLPLMLASLAARGVQRGWRLGDKIRFKVISRGSYHYFGYGNVAAD